MVKEKQVFNGKLLKVFVRTTKLPNNFMATVEYIKHPGAVLIVPVFENGEILLIRQFRHALGKFIWELPAGTLEKKESLSACAKRELIEETGFKAGNLKKLTVIYPVPGYATEKISIFKATKLTKVTKNTMEDEVITAKVFIRSQIMDMLNRRVIRDAKTICALTYLFLEGHSF